MGVMMVPTKKEKIARSTKKTQQRKKQRKNSRARRTTRSQGGKGSGIKWSQIKGIK